MFDIDLFYSENSIDDWNVILGEKLHYHIGSTNKENIDIFDYAVKEIADLLDENTTVLDCGCGWGGPSRYLIKHKNINVMGVTISKGQCDSITDFDVVRADLQEYIPENNYDSAIFLESLTHIENFEKVIKNIHGKVKNIIIKDFCAKTPYFIPEWCMHVRRLSEYRKILQKYDYDIHFCREYDEQSLKENFYKSFLYWQNNIRKIPLNKITGQIFLLKHISDYHVFHGGKFDISMFLIKGVGGTR